MSYVFFFSRVAELNSAFCHIGENCLCKSAVNMNLRAPSSLSNCPNSVLLLDRFRFLLNQLQLF